MISKIFLGIIISPLLACYYLYTTSLATRNSIQAPWLLLFKVQKRLICHGSTPLSRVYTQLYINGLFFNLYVNVNI